MPDGVVKWFNARKGFGFIAGADDRPDIFVHFSEIVSEHSRKLHQGDEVRYDLVQGEMGPKAARVVKKADGAVSH